ncbi:MAG: zinc ABC transporter substrate-binding protein [Rhodospirillales bacterium]|nr:zinc ABC transporter substrate-binding protein [Rhodospirillales bacterium]
MARIALTLAALFAGFHLALAVPARAEPPRVVVSIPPIHSLAAGVMDGIATPELLIKGGASPHTYSLKPSDAKALTDAQLVFWIGENLEVFLVKPLAALADKAKVVELIETPGLRLLSYRSGGSWKHRDNDHGHDHAGKDKTEKNEQSDHAHGETDAHIWLSPANARVLTAAVVTTLAEADPANVARYRENGQRLNDRLAALEAEMKTALAPVRDRPFVVFHDAYQYLEDSFSLNAIGAVAVTPEKPPGPKSLMALRKRIKTSRARCVFREPQFSAKLAETVTEGTGARIAVLDPEGLSGAPGANLYFDLMRANVRALAECLGSG